MLQRRNNECGERAERARRLRNRGAVSTNAWLGSTFGAELSEATTPRAQISTYRGRPRRKRGGVSDRRRTLFGAARLRR